MPEFFEEIEEMGSQKQPVEKLTGEEVTHFLTQGYMQCLEKNNLEFTDDKKEQLDRVIKSARQKDEELFEWQNKRTQEGIVIEEKNALISLLGQYGIKISDAEIAHYYDAITAISIPHMVALWIANGVDEFEAWGKARSVEACCFNEATYVTPKENQNLQILNNFGYVHETLHRLSTFRDETGGVISNGMAIPFKAPKLHELVVSKLTFEALSDKDGQGYIDGQNPDEVFEHEKQQQKSINEILEILSAVVSKRDLVRANFIPSERERVDKVFTDKLGPNSLHVIALLIDLDIDEDLEKFVKGETISFSPMEIAYGGFSKPEIENPHVTITDDENDQGRLFWKSLRPIS